MNLDKLTNMHKSIPSLSFIFLIFCAAFSMEAIGTYISIIGLGALFAGDPVILVLAGILDGAKIVSVSFLYQYWAGIKALMKYYMLIAVIVLMTITSAGAFGYLSGSFQKAIQPNMEISLKVDSYNNERTQLTTEKEQLKAERINLDKQIASLPSDDVDGRRRLIKSFKPESARISDRLTTVTKRVDDLNAMVLKVESESIDTRVHAGPITYVSKAFNISVEQASKVIILTIIFVFDPLAVILLLSGNFLVKTRRELKAEEATRSLKTEPKVTPQSFESILPEVSTDIPMPVVKPPRQDEASTGEVSHINLDQVTFTPVADEPVEEPEWKVTVSDPNLLVEVNPSDEAPTYAAPNTNGDLMFDPYEEVEEGFSPVETTDPSIDELLSKVYDDVDTGEAPYIEDVEALWIEPNELEAAVMYYVPVEPTQPETTAEVPEPLMQSTLEDLKISIPEALLHSGHVTTSKHIGAYNE
jgi:hypothetical protein